MRDAPRRSLNRPRTARAPRSSRRSRGRRDTTRAIDRRHACRRRARRRRGARGTQVEARFLAKLPHVDPKLVGLLGDSQAGWIIAYAAAHEPAVRWAVPIVGPTVTVGQSDFWAGLAGQSESPPSGTQSEMLKQTRAAGSFGFDPRPWLAKLTIPVFWTFGADDRNVPTVLCVEALEALQPGHDFSWVILPKTHTPIVLPTGLLSSLRDSPGFHPDFFTAIGKWLRSRGMAG